jgi:hypothetical protein
MGLLKRRDDWPQRLAAVVAGAQARPYVLGEWDCWRFACACIEAMTDTDFWPRFSGYKTKRQALVTIARIAPTLGEALTITLGVEPQDTRMAHRGDLALYLDATGMEHIGVCLGARVAVLGAGGLQQVPVTDAGLLAAWRVG